jgi:NTP pyrophosphatase (non-canonical NTP hydrolase)
MRVGEFSELGRLGDYQELARATDQLEAAFREEIDPELALKRLIPLLGMAGEVGSLLVEYKKYLRDGDAHPLFPDHVAEELGDILWYLANTASKFDLSLTDIALSNLNKIRRRWPARGEPPVPYVLFDDGRHANEQLPRKFSAEIEEVKDDDGFFHVEISIDGKAAGDRLRDNSKDEDGYRFHDVFHLAHAAMLGWSPVLRGKLLHVKRASDEGLMEVEDGGRAIVVDEAVVAYVWGYAQQQAFLEGATTIDFTVLKTIDHLTSGLEVSERQLYEWEEAILAGYRVFRAIRKAGGGVVEVDLLARRIDLAT